MARALVHRGPDGDGTLRDAQVRLDNRRLSIIDVAGEDRRLVFQAVHMILEGDYQGAWRDTGKRYSRLVFIGRNLDEAALRAGFEACAAA